MSLRHAQHDHHGAVRNATFELEGQEFHALNGGPYLAFTPATSLFVSCETQAEVVELWDKPAARLRWGWWGT